MGKLYDDNFVKRATILKQDMTRPKPKVGLKATVSRSLPLKATVGPKAPPVSVLVRLPQTLLDRIDRCEARSRNAAIVAILDEGAPK